MNEMRSLFDRLLEEPGPPLPTSEEVIAAGRRARRRQIRHRAAGFALTVAVALAGLGLDLLGLDLLGRGENGAPPPLPPAAHPSHTMTPSGGLTLTAADFDQAEMLFVASTSDAVGGVWFGTWSGTAPLRWYLSYARIEPGGPCEHPTLPQVFPRRPSAGVDYSCTELPNGDSAIWVARWDGPELRAIQVHVPLSVRTSVIYTVSNVDLLTWAGEPSPPHAEAGPMFALSDSEIISLALATISPSNLPTHLSLSEYLLGMSEPSR